MASGERKSRIVTPATAKEKRLMKQSPGAKTPRYWRSLDELADTGEFRAFVESEFPSQAPLMNDALSRRQFLKLMGASLAMCGLTACAPNSPSEKIFSWVRAPEASIPGRARHYATTLELAGFGRGAVVKSFEGRPTKTEGNPEHPYSRGASDVILQADVLSLYDPDRLQAPKLFDQLSDWQSFTEELGAQRWRSSGAGQGFFVVSGRIASPSLIEARRNFLAKYPKARWIVYEALHRDFVHEATLAAFGTRLDPHPQFQLCDVVVSFGGDFLGTGPAQIRWARDFVSTVSPTAARNAKATLNTTLDARNFRKSRLYVAESFLTPTGAMADSRRALRPSQLRMALVRLAQLVGVELPGKTTAYKEKGEERGEETGAHETEAWLAQLAAELKAHKGRSLLWVGQDLSPELQVLAYGINEKLGNLGKTLLFRESADLDLGHEGPTALAELEQALERGQVEALAFLNANPIYTGPGSTQLLAEKIRRVPWSCYLGLHENETARECRWRLPASHGLERWGDLRAYDGSPSLVQPLIAPLYESRSDLEFVSLLNDENSAGAYDQVRAYWKAHARAADFESWWREALLKGVIELDTPAFRTPGVQNGAIEGLAAWLEKVKSEPFRSQERDSSSDSSLIEIHIAPDPCLWDGRYANNAWLQELPKSVSHLCWDNAAYMSPELARRLGAKNESVVRIERQGQSVEAPVWIQAGLPDQFVQLHLGYGRSASGRVGDARGFRAYALWGGESWSYADAKLKVLNRKHEVACTQLHHSMEGEGIIQSISLAELRGPRSVNDTKASDTKTSDKPPSLFPDYNLIDDGYAWGMSIDLSACIGCNACVAACQAENNIPVVGPKQVRIGREMHWLRVDSYFTGPVEHARAVFQPVPCMHCEKAPCETVCPVGATVHDRQGLNEMVYNRCVGTRYCSNNCPYKVRRFNFLHYSNDSDPSIALQKNPNVSVRGRGVMEKCTYCIQRIQEKRIGAERERRRVNDGEIQTACQQSCPTSAIVFGNIADPKAQVAQLKSSPQAYDLLAELGTRPRTSYLKRIVEDVQHIVEDTKDSVEDGNS
jgi:molybdopterin-containing oxidoreductase family iron-sulfur binding subunit